MDSSVDTSAMSPGSMSLVMFYLPPFDLLEVELSTEAGHVLATDLLTHSYGEGKTALDAIDALSLAIRRHYAWLEDEGLDRLSDRFQRQLIQLRFRAARANLPPSVPSREALASRRLFAATGGRRSWAAA